MKKVFLIMVLCIALLGPVSARDDIIFRTNQSKYSFLVGQNAVIPFETENNLKEAVQGIMTITIYSTNQERPESRPFMIEEGENVFSVGLGSSGSPAEMNIKTEFAYSNDKGEEMIVTMPLIEVAWVQDSSQQKNKRDTQKSSSESQEKREEREKKEAEKRMEEEMKQQEIQNQVQNKLQNNQMDQNTQNLKNQMESQKQMQNKFAENLGKNEEFSERHQELLKKGYKVKDEEIDAEDGENGEFKIDYENEQGEEASLEGVMENNTITDIEMTEDREFLEILGNDSRFQRYESMLEEQGFQRGNYSIESADNITSVDIHYSKGNETALIKAEIEDKHVKDVKLYRDSNLIWISLFAGLLLISSASLLYLKSRKKEEIPMIDEPIKVFDFKKEARKMLGTAKRLFEDKEYKEAYAKAAESARFFYIHKLRINKEVTNTEIVRLLRSGKMDYRSLQKALNLCGLVEFAKYKANKKDFDEILRTVEEMLG